MPRNLTKLAFGHLRPRTEPAAAPEPETEPEITEDLIDAAVPPTHIDLEPITNFDVDTRNLNGMTTENRIRHGLGGTDYTYTYTIGNTTNNIRKPAQQMYQAFDDQPHWKVKREWTIEANKQINLDLTAFEITKKPENDVERTYIIVLTTQEIKIAIYDNGWRLQDNLKDDISENVTLWMDLSEIKVQLALKEG